MNTGYRSCIPDCLIANRPAKRYRGRLDPGSMATIVQTAKNEDVATTSNTNQLSLFT